MKPSTLPVICGIALAAASTAGLSHWWSVRQFLSAVETGVHVVATPKPNEKPTSPPPEENAPKSLPKDTKTVTPVLARNAPASPAAPTPDPRQQEFYEALLSKLENLQNQNRDLLDQLAETNRDVMKLEFRVDTHSESFRPLPVSEERPDTSFENEPGVLPPRAEPVMLPSHE